MLQLPPAQTPLNQHSLMALENWLVELGAKKSLDYPCQWTWTKSEWSAKIFLKQDEITIVWEKNNQVSECFFPYGLTRADVEAAIMQGP